jgi:hypothetical protein
MTTIVLAAPGASMFDANFGTIILAIATSLLILGAFVKSAPWLDRLEAR